MTATLSPAATREDALLRGAEAAHDAGERRRRLAVGTLRLLVLAGLLGFWSYASGRLTDRLFLSDPVAVARAFWRAAASGDLWYHVRFTLLETVAGYAIGVTLGLLAALAVALTPRLHRVTQPFLIAFYAIPKIALAPLIIIWFGLGLLPKILLASLFVFFIVFLNTVAGIHSVSPQLINLARVMGASSRDLLTKIVLPGSVPFIIAALRLTIPSAMIGAVVGEFISSNRGLGYLINAASSRYDTATVFAGIGSLLIAVVTMDFAVSMVERRLLRWRPQGQAAPRM